MPKCKNDLTNDHNDLKNTETEAYLGHCLISMMEFFFAERVNGIRSFTVSVKKLYHRCLVGSRFASEISIDAGLSVQLPLIFGDLGFIYYCQLSPEAANDQHYITILYIIYIFYLQK